MNPKPLQPVVTRVLLAATLLALAGCANFRKLGRDLKFIDETSVVTCRITNADRSPRVYGLVIEWDRETDKVLSADYSKVGEVGVFGFFVERSENQYLIAFSDRNGNKIYDSGEPAWIHSDASGTPAPVAIDPETNKARESGALSTATKLPADLLKAAREFKGARTAEEAASGYRIPVDLGTIADLDDPKFSSKTGSDGLWKPASFPMESGIGIYFLEKYDSKKTPVLFVYGAAGSPQDWRTFFERIDRTKYQPWFYFYPTGARLDEMGTALNNGVQILQAHHGFQKLHVVAHSMGGLVSRSFVVKNVIEDEQPYIQRFVTISTPWQGHAAAQMGIDMAPSVVPSWYDMKTDSDFQKEVFSRDLKGRVDHLLIYGHLPKGDKPLEEQTDGTVAVKSELSPAAVKDAVRVSGYQADHVGILSKDEVIREVFGFLVSGAENYRN